MENKPNGIATPDDWRAGSQAARQARAERLRLPSGAVVLAARPEPLEWIFSGRLPQRLLGAALGNGARNGGGNAEPRRSARAGPLRRAADPSERRGARHR